LAALFLLHAVSDLGDLFRNNNLRA